MRRRAIVTAAWALLMAFIAAAPVAAHGLVGRQDLPIAAVLQRSGLWRNLPVALAHVLRTRQEIEGAARVELLLALHPGGSSSRRVASNARCSRATNSSASAVRISSKRSPRDPLIWTPCTRSLTPPPLPEDRSHQHQHYLRDGGSVHWSPAERATPATSYLAGTGHCATGVRGPQRPGSIAITLLFERAGRGSLSEGGSVRPRQAQVPDRGSVQPSLKHSF